MKYIRMHQVEAEPMTRGAYNEFRGWTIPANENPADEGYKVTYPDGYVSWCPKAQFEKSAFTLMVDAPFDGCPQADLVYDALRSFHNHNYATTQEKGSLSESLVRAYYNEYVGRLNGCLTFGMAIEEMKRGKKVARRGWNGKGQFVTVGNQFTYVDCNGKQNAEHQTSGSAALIFHGTIGVQVGWLASQSDMLSEDWLVVD